MFERVFEKNDPGVLNTDEGKGEAELSTTSPDPGGLEDGSPGKIFSPELSTKPPSQKKSF